MGLQHEGAHARVFRGLDGERKMVQLRKRETDYNDNVHRFIHIPSHNTNHNNIKMNVPEGFEATATSSADDGKSTLALQNKAQADDSDDVETVYSVVYQTMSQTFEGTPAGYVTESSAATPTNIAQSGASSTTAPAAAASNTGNADEAAYESIKAQAQGASSATSSPTSNAYPTRQMLPNAASSAISASTDVSDATAAIAGSATNTAVGANVVGGSPVAATRTPEESNSGMTGGAKAGLAFGIILGLGLLAGLAFFCYRRRKNPKQHEEINEKFNEKSGFPVAQSNRFSADSDKSSLRSSNTPATAPRLSLRPVTQFLPNLSNSQNKDLSVANTPLNEKASAWERRPQNSAQNPFGDAAVMSEKQSNPFDEGDGNDRTNSMSSTASAEPSTGTAAAVPVARGPNNVHRVQLDFKPSMEDELELISGQLVRMLHEYDDGWALCIRMDRTQQGVVPRTCLSKLPVKPRGPPQGGRPQGPPSNGMPSPPPGPDAMAPRPLTPTSTRSRSGTMEAVPARKPVPGQAL